LSSNHSRVRRSISGDGNSLGSYSDVREQLLNDGGTHAKVIQKAVLFDLDGTLTDPGVGIFNSVAYAFNALSLPPLNDEQLRGFVGPPLQDSFASLGLGSYEVATAVEAYREYFGKRGLYENEVYPGVPDALDALRAEGFGLVVATSKPRVFAERILRHFKLAHHFAIVVGSELDGSRRHKHEVVAACLDQIGTTKIVAMVGDREHDVRGAAAHGIPCVGVAWGYAGDEELADAGAAIVIDKPAQLLRALTSIIGSEDRGALR
jgi:phosphoglycolate phosphatase